MKAGHWILFSVLGVACFASPIIRIQTRNETKRTYCCYSVAKPLDMNAKAKQGLFALHQLGFDLKKLRNVVAFQEKTLKERLQGAKKKAESISQQVKHALRDTMKILSDASEKAAKKLGELEGLSNDLRHLSENLGATKTRDALKEIQEFIVNKPHLKKLEYHKKAKKHGKVPKKKKAGKHSTMKIKRVKFRAEDRIPPQNTVPAVPVH